MGDRTFRKIFQCIIAQCTDKSKAKIQCLSEYEVKKRGKDCAWLLEEIKKIHFKSEDRKDPFMLMYEAQASLYKEYKYEHVSLMEFYNKFKSKVEVIEHRRGCIGHDEGLLNVIAEEKGIIEEEILKRYLTRLQIFFDLVLDKTRRCSLQEPGDQPVLRAVARVQHCVENLGPA